MPHTTTNASALLTSEKNLARRTPKIENLNDMIEFSNYMRSNNKCKQKTIIIDLIFYLKSTRINTEFDVQKC